ncbi:protein kinase family protein with leucine-rich repeat domain-containing protein [Artemisia annua]|uniref:Protein kinase family protein with leucine-rich repeat domain-containing protein n=1 Tax=Artemisia annua TaxID=35608 RepID=A0A2U1PPI1_ARTAN|nr:protein kinase family protein with leucine-rich repeat domain-containing protein [Artemisia annua]
MTKTPRKHILNTLTFIFIIVLESLSVTSQHLSTSEIATLLNLKKQWNNPDTLNNWNSTSATPCTWPEVTCNVNNSVIHLNLMSKQLSGNIPPEICDLQNLETLNITDNYFTGEFPKILYNCSGLTRLDLSQNSFVGSLPDDIDQFSRLEYVDLGANNFTGDIPPAIGNLSGLRTLKLYSNLFEGSVPKEIGNLSNLEILGMAYNKFRAWEIPVEFGKLRNLKNLWMPQSSLIGRIPDSFADFVNLEHLDLSFNSLEGGIPGGLFLLKNLSLLYLYKNGLSGEIPKVVECVELVEIDISMNKLTGSIPEDFGKLERLEVMNLFSNQLSGNIPTGISQISTLKIFRVFRNSLSGELPSEMGLNSKLEAFEVSENKLTGKLPENLCRGGTLFVVVAFSNNLSGEIPRSLESCQKLNNIQLYDNSFTGEFPSGIWTLFNLSSLRLTGNSISGELPSKVAWNLSRLEISDNKFSGRIPEGISSWTKLNVFKASNNLFSGEIPSGFTNLSELSVIYLDGNSLSGELPSEIKSWSSLTMLNLARNKLSGSIPVAITSLPHLLDLDLSENQFSGPIPPQLSRLRLTTLNLSSNKLTGRVPFAFDNMAYGNSFLNNPNLCAKSPISNLHNCNTPYAKSSHGQKVSTKIVVMIVVLSAFIILLAILCTLFVFRGYRKKIQSRDLTTWKLTSFHKLEFTEANILCCMTENNLIGSGGSGKVYQIEIGRRGEYVAVKRIFNNRKLDHTLEKEFLSEVHILGSIRHSNIVKLLCCFSSEDSKLLVYEYMENQSLDKWLHGKKMKSNRGLVHHMALDWPRRLQIAIGAAQGLCYMHHDCSPPIIHRDVKSSNILLDSEFKARIADFGLAKILTKPKPGQANTLSGIAGSFGYIPPEYAYSTRINERVDVYSFGVVLLELVTGKEPHEGDADMNLAEWAWKNYGEGNSMVEALDPEIKHATGFMEEIGQVFKLGLICTSTLPSSRPSMKEVLEILNRCNRLSEDRKVGGEEFDVAPLLRRESYLSNYRRNGNKVVTESFDIFDGRL